MFINKTNFENRSRRKVLMICGHFPPEAATGAIRSVKFVKYLPKFGWDPVVLTVNHQVDEAASGLLSQIPLNVRVYRTRILKKFPINDLGAKWFPFLLRKANMMVRENRFDVVYLTGDPFVTFWLGYILWLIYKIPYILDYRDSWSTTPYVFPGWKSKLSWIIGRFSEPFLCRRAGAVICVSEHMKEDLLKLCQNLPFDHSKVIYNGFDEEDFRVIEQTNPPKRIVEHKQKGRWVWIHVGRLDQFMSSIPLFTALATLRDEGQEWVKRIQLIFVGPVDSENVEEISKKYGLENQVEHIETLSHFEAQQYAYHADALLLFGSHAAQRLNLKVFEYVRTGLPILSIIHPNGANAQVLHSLGIHTISDPADTNGCRIEVVRVSALMQEHIEKRQALARNLYRYERSYLTEQLAKILDLVVMRVKRA